MTMKEIDIQFDVYSDTPKNKDPDTNSPTLLAGKMMYAPIVLAKEKKVLISFFGNLLVISFMLFDEL